MKSSNFNKGRKFSIGRSKAPTNNQKGLTLIELLTFAALFAIVGIVFGPRLAGVFSGQEIGTAQVEIDTVMAAGSVYRSAPANQGLYTGISVTELNNSGYQVAPFTTGVNQNVFGATVAIASVASNTDATVTYGTEDAQACAQLVERYTNDARVKGTPSCTGANFSVTID